jgi:hypothetical protein
MSIDVADRQTTLPAPATLARERPAVSKRPRLRHAVLAAATLALAGGFAGGAQAQVLQNGNFGNNNAGSGAAGANGTGSVHQQVTYGNTQSPAPPANAVTLPNWTNTSTYSFILNSNNSNSFSNSQQTPIGLYGPTPNPQTTGIPAPPAAANSTYYLATDGAYGGYTQGWNSNNSQAGQQGAPANNYAYTYQLVTGLQTGTYYAVTFWMSAAEQIGFTGDTTDTWDLGFTDSAPTNSTGITNTAGPNSTGASQTLNLNQSGCNQTTACTWYGSWVEQTIVLLANASSEYLWFLANDTETMNNNLPPFSLLTGISISQTTPPVPEPPAYALVLVGLLAMLGVRRLRRPRAA